MQEKRGRLSAKLLMPFKMKITDGRKLVTLATTAAEAVLFIIIIRIRISDKYVTPYSRNFLSPQFPASE
jgi:hypothetical protein